MARAVVCQTVLLAAFCIAMAGQSDPRLQTADLAWDRGDYVTALKEYLALLDSSDANQLMQPIALQTGELFQTLELTPDGGAPRFSPAGTHFTYELGRGVARRTRLASIDAPTRTLAELPGYAAVFSSEGSQLAYLRLPATPEMLELERSVDSPTGTERTQRLATLARVTETAARITLRDVATGRERELDVGRRKNALLAANGVVLFTGSDADGVDQVYLVADGGAPRPLTSGEPGKILQELNSTDTAALFTHRPQRGRGAASATPSRFGIVTLPAGAVTLVTGSSPAFSADGRAVAYVTGTDTGFQLTHAPVDSPATTTIARTGPERLDAPVWSPDGRRLAFQLLSSADWELHIVGRDGSDEQRITREIQHDVAPRFLNDHRLLGLIGEPRHRRSYLYDLSSNRRMRLFHNNTVRTIAPEYAWAPSPDGTKVLVVAERDGDTVSLERGVYLVDLTKTVTIDDLRARIRSNLATEEALRAKAKKVFSPIADRVQQVVAEASVARVFSYEKALFDFDSKHITRPGNRLASEYLFNTYRAFGYEPEYQWFSPRGARGGQTANVLAALKGTTHPELVYVVSSHYDSVAEGPGADDNSSGTAALLETARVLAQHPQEATIVFASFTGEESGLLGSREYVRRAVADNVQIVGALNNDMVGWTNDHRLDNTIRYSNPGFRDIQHAAAMQFSRLITYDALYFRSTDAHSYYDAYGDIFSGIGSYPILGNPHYHQSHDVLETINHQLVTEVAKVTAASVMLLASSPSRLKGLKIEAAPNGNASVTWIPSPEKNVTGYLVAWGPADQSESHQIRVTKAAATIKVPIGTVISVKAVNDKGLEGWDWARAKLQ